MIINPLEKHPLQFYSFTVVLFSYHHPPVCKHKEKIFGNDINLNPKIVGLRLYYCLSKNADDLSRRYLFLKKNVNYTTIHTKKFVVYPSPFLFTEMEDLCL